MPFEPNHEVSAPTGAWAAVVLCHPHPDYGGDMHNVVIESLFSTLVGVGAAALRFDFRSSEPETARRDTVAAIDTLDSAVGDTPPLVLAGYSFGANVALSVGHDRLAGWFAIAPPLQFGPPAGLTASGDARPKRLLVPEHDQYAPPPRVRAAIANWVATELSVVPSGDHFLVGRTQVVADACLAFVRSLA